MTTTTEAVTRDDINTASDAYAELFGFEHSADPGDCLARRFSRYRIAALAQGRLEGAEAMREAAAKKAYVPNRVTLNAWRTREAITASIRNLSAKTVASQIGEK
jgi:hypothetical protein